MFLLTLPLRDKSSLFQYDPLMYPTLISPINITSQHNHMLLSSIIFLITQLNLNYYDECFDLPKLNGSLGIITNQLLVIVENEIVNSISSHITSLTST